MAIGAVLLGKLHQGNKESQVSRLKPLVISDRSMRESALPSWTPTAWCLTRLLPSCLQTMATWASMSPYPCAEWSLAVLPPSRVTLGLVTLTFKWLDCLWPFKMEGRGVKCSTEEIDQGIIGPPPVLAASLSLVPCSLNLWHCAHYSHPNLFCKFQ